MMKPKQTLSAMTVLWASLALLEGVSSLIRRWYTRKMGTAARAVVGVVGFGKMALMILLALANAALFLRHVDSDGDGGGRRGRGDEGRGYGYGCDDITEK